MTIVSMRSASDTIQVGTLTLTGDIEENDYSGLPDEPTTYTIYLDDLNDPGIQCVTMEVTLEWLTMHGIELFEHGVPLEELLEGGQIG